MGVLVLVLVWGWGGGCLPGAREVCRVGLEACVGVSAGRPAVHGSVEAGLAGPLCPPCNAAAKTAHGHTPSLATTFVQMWSSLT